MPNLMSRLENQERSAVTRRYCGGAGRPGRFGLPAARAALANGRDAGGNERFNGRALQLVPRKSKIICAAYGASPGPIDEDFRKSIIGADKVIDYRPADDLKPQFENLKRKYQDLARTDEDVLSIALFENVAVNFLENKYLPRKEKEIHEINLHIG